MSQTEKKCERNRKLRQGKKMKSLIKNLKKKLLNALIILSSNIVVRASKGKSSQKQLKSKYWSKN